MADYFRETSAGQAVRFFTGNRVLLYPEERDNFRCPNNYECHNQRHNSQDTVVNPSPQQTTPPNEKAAQNQQAAADTTQPIDKARKDIEKGQPNQPKPEHAKATPQYTVVDWYGDDDPDNPQNWPMKKKVAVAGVIGYLTFAVYIAAAIITPGSLLISQEFGVSDEAVALTLALYVLAYGVGPLIWSPLSEVPAYGRNLFYIPPFFIVFLLSIGVPLTPTFGGLLVLRFLTGFFASPALATGGASMADIFPPQQIPYAFILWSMSAVFGPALGPTISTFAVAHFNTWRWAMWIQLMITGIALLAIFFGLPETSSPNILLRRARRLRKLTGNKNLRSQSEIDQAGMQMRTKLKDAMIKPFEIPLLDPAVAFADLLITFVYAVYYLFFTSFPLVLEGIYHWSINSQSLAFISIVIFIGLGAMMYLFYYWKWGSKLPMDHPERRLDAALVAVCLPPIGLFMYAWTSRESVSPYVGLLGIGLFSAGVYVLFQTLLFYISLTYPAYAASILAGNDFLRSAGAAGIVMAGLPFYRNLGIPAANSILGGISIVFIPMMFGLHQYGHKLRARSRFAVHDE